MKNRIEASFRLCLQQLFKSTHTVQDASYKILAEFSNTLWNNLLSDYFLCMIVATSVHVAFLWILSYYGTPICGL